MKPQKSLLLLGALVAAATGHAGLVGHWTFENGSLVDITGNFEAMVLEGDAVVAYGALDVLIWNRGAPAATVTVSRRLNANGTETVVVRVALPLSTGRYIRLSVPLQ